MAKLPFEFIDFKEETFSDYVSRYDIELSNFLSEFEDNTEALFVDYEINNFTYHKDELSEFIRNIDLSSESREEYLQFLKNRVGYFNDKNDNEIELFESDKRKEYSYYYNFLKNRRASVFKILEFLESKKENGNISKSASNDNKKDITSMPWFIVGLSDAKGDLDKIHGSFRKKAKELGINNHSYVQKKEYKYSIDKTRYIHDYCIENNIDTTDEFKRIVDEFKKIDKNQDW